MTLTTELLERLVSEMVAKKAGLSLPVTYQAKWGWSPGAGPVVQMRVWPAANVEKFDPKRRK